MCAITFNADADGCAETFISRYDLTFLSASVIRNYQQAIFRYEMAKRDGDYTLAERYARMASEGTPVAYYCKRGWNWSHGQRIDQSTVTGFRDEVLRNIRKMEVM